MIDSIAKIIPMITVAGGTAASSPKLKAQIAKIMEATKVVATQQEISDITKMIYMDSIDGSHPKPEELTEYLHRNMRNTNGNKRDTAQDQWGQVYKLRYDTQRKEIIVSSAGPDKQFDSADDIKGIYPLDTSFVR